MVIYLGKMADWTGEKMVYRGKIAILLVNSEHGDLPR